MKIFKGRILSGIIVAFVGVFLMCCYQDVSHQREIEWLVNIVMGLFGSAFFLVIFSFLKGK